MTKKITAKRKEMMAIAMEHLEKGIEVRIIEEESPHRGRIIKVHKGKTILIMR